MPDPRQAVDPGFIGEEPKLPPAALSEWRRIMRLQLRAMERFIVAQRFIAECEQQKQKILARHGLQSTADKILDGATSQLGGALQ